MRHTGFKGMTQGPKSYRFDLARDQCQSGLFALAPHPANPRPHGGGGQRGGRRLRTCRRQDLVLRGDEEALNQTVQCESDRESRFCVGLMSSPSICPTIRSGDGGAAGDKWTRPNEDSTKSLTGTIPTPTCICTSGEYGVPSMTTLLKNYEYDEKRKTSWS